jgi:signal transduction histidine kinase
MRERATAAGGTLAIKSGGTGTLVRMTVPVRTSAGGERCQSKC